MRTLALLLILSMQIVGGTIAHADDDKVGDKPDDKQEQPDQKEPAKKPAGGRAVLVERVVAVVNDTVILESEVLQRAAANAQDLDDIQDPREKQRQWKALVRQTLLDMVDEELIIQGAAEASLDVTEDEIDKSIDEVKTNNHLSDEQFKQALQAQGYTPESYRKDVRRNILRLRAINILVRPRVTITDDEVRAYYDKMVSQKTTVTQVRASVILILLSENATEDEKSAARQRAGNLIERAKGGEDFATLAQNNSEDQETKDKGGDLGWFKRGELPSEWEEVLFAMEKDEIRGPIQGPRGLHIFKLTDVKKEGAKSFESMKDRLRNQLYNEQLEKQTKIWLEEQKKKAHVEIKL
jgi:parvulin-like peptidyl-prolyl isomerase